MNEDFANQGLVDHLTELRTRLVYSLVAIAVGFVGCWMVSDVLFSVIRAPIQPFLQDIAGGLVFTAPMDKFLAHIKVSLLGSIIVMSPFWIYQLWKFVEPGLYQKEKKFGLAFIFFGTVLFLAGVSFVYFIVYPMAFEFLMNFGGETDKPMITIKDYLSFFITTTLVFGFAFEMPLMFAILGRMGLVTQEFLRQSRRYAIVIIAALCAIITPPDVVSMFFMLVPMVILYEVSVFLVGKGES